MARPIKQLEAEAEVETELCRRLMCLNQPL